MPDKRITVYLAGGPCAGTQLEVDPAHMHTMQLPAPPKRQSTDPAGLPEEVGEMVLYKLEPVCMTVAGGHQTILVGVPDAWVGDGSHPFSHWAREVWACYSGVTKNIEAQAQQEKYEREARAHDALDEA